MSQHCRANPCCGDRPCSGIPLPQHASGLPSHNKSAALAGRDEAMSEIVAYRIKDYGDGWILQESLTDSERAIYAEQGNVVQALVPADRTASLEREVEELRADCKRKDELLTAAVDDYNDARSLALEEAAALIEDNVIQDTSAGKVLRPRQDGNRDGLHYAAAIRRIQPSEAEGREG